MTYQNLSQILTGKPLSYLSLLNLKGQCQLLSRCHTKHL
jgi:hypothetical protein